MWFGIDLTYTESMVAVKHFPYTKCMSAKMGRPKKKKGEQKIPFPIRFARDDVAAFKRAARSKKQEVAEWVTETLKTAAYPTSSGLGTTRD